MLHRLPPGASPVATPVLRPLPGGEGRLFVGLAGSGALPAWVLPGAACPARAWALVPGAEGAMLVGGDSLAPAPPGAPPLPDPPYPPPRLSLARREEEPEAPPPVPAPGRGGFRLDLPGGVLDVPFAALARLLPMPDLHPLPDAPPGTRGLAWTETGPALVVALAPSPGAEEEAAAPLLAVLLAGGRRIGLACRGAAPVPEAPPLPPALLAPALLAAAPLDRPAPAAAPPPPSRLLLLARAGAAAFALPLEEVDAVLPPVRPHHGGGAVAGIAAHRGEVLPVIDAGTRLGEAAVLRGGAVPMLRLQGSPAAALAVSEVLGLRAVPEAELAPVAGGGVLAAVARLDGAVLPVCRARALAAPLGTVAAARAARAPAPAGAAP